MDSELFPLLDATYARFMGRPLAPSNTSGAEWLYHDAPFAVLAHDTSVRIAKSGRRFWILDGTVWQLHDEHGVYRGQAAMFTKWQDL